jgi:NAD(P)-dependent dehydrogenase (short-subunit alcohol dehydrogenase family)
MVVLITGARSGIGRATALSAGRAGHAVYAGFRDLSTSDQLMKDADGLSIVPVQLDITNEDDRVAVQEQILAAEGHLDVLVNNAGVALGGFLEQVEEDEIRRLFDVNFFGTWALTRLWLPSMRARREGLVVNVSSMAGRMAMPGLGSYAASKFALEGMTEALRHELKPWGVRVVCIEPGAYKTDIWGVNRTVSRNSHDPDSDWAGMVKRMDTVFQKVVDKQAKEPDEVGDHIVGLFSAKNPVLRHPLGGESWLRMLVLKLAPFSWIEFAMRRALRFERYIAADGDTSKPQRS